MSNQISTIKPSSFSRVDYSIKENNNIEKEFFDSLDTEQIYELREETIREIDDVINKCYYNFPSTERYQSLDVELLQNKYFKAIEKLRTSKDDTINLSVLLPQFTNYNKSMTYKMNNDGEKIYFVLKYCDPNFSILKLCDETYYHWLSITSSPTKAYTITKNVLESYYPGINPLNIAKLERRISSIMEEQKKGTYSL